METSEGIKMNCSGGITRPELEKLLQPVIELHSIEVKDDRLEFPGIHPSVGVPESEKPEDTERAVVRLEDISSVCVLKARIELLLRSGELYVFSTTDSVRTHINTHNGGGSKQSKKPVTAQEVAGNIWDGLEKIISSGKK